MSILASETLSKKNTYLYNYAVDLAAENATDWTGAAPPVMDESLYVVLLEEESSEILSYPDLDDLEYIWREREHLRRAACQLVGVERA
jgi:hypothetical protein